MKEDPLLHLLRSKADGHVSGEEISRSLGMTRQGVWKAIENLRALGYRIEAHAGLGYRLIAVPDKMFSDEIAHGLSTKFVGNRILSYEETDSTNDVAWRLGEEGQKEGLCVFAEHQRKGRGRLGRSWASPKGKNILLSVLLRPVMPPAEVSKITITAAVSAAKTVQKITGKKPGIKWPNDILYEGKKVCGILTEMSAEADRVKFVVVGIGINVNASFKELPPRSISLKEVAGLTLSRHETARAFLSQLEEDYSKLKEARFDEIADEWEGFSDTSGRRVAAEIMGKKIQGVALGIDRDGALWIRQDNGLQEKITAGDISL